MVGDGLVVGIWVLVAVGGGKVEKSYECCRV